MKKLILIGIIALISAGQAFANDGYRYSTTYSNWDSGFNRHYGYNETTCNVKYRNGYRTSVCYDNYEANDRVYIEEVRMNGGSYNHTVVNVYRDSAYTTRVSTYYVDRSSRPAYYRGGRGRVVRRNYYGHSHHRSNWHYDSYYTSYVYVDLDSATGTFIRGLWTAGVAIDILDDCDNAVCGVIGVGAGVLAIAKSAKASEKAAKKSDLQKSLENNAKVQSESDLVDTTF
jgi:hypothetical protein